MPHTALDNPVWSALITTHAGFAIGDGAARRYPADVTPMVGMESADDAGFTALRALVGPGATVPLFLSSDDPPPFPVVYARDIAQMVLASHVANPRHDLGRPLCKLDTADVPEMLALAELTKPGPFGHRTVEFGGFLGIREGGILVAMAGTRLRPAGFCEISAVCVHPDWQGRGYGRAVTEGVVATVQGRGEIAFLHVKTDNAAARNVYLGLGFQDRRSIHLRVIRLPE
jgi:ribosomal protein S18 acetylase RimI-like enzyme